MPRLRSALQDMENATGQKRAFIAANVRFHEAIAEEAGNGVLTFLLQALGDVLAKPEGHLRRPPADDR